MFMLFLALWVLERSSQMLTILNYWMQYLRLQSRTWALHESGSTVLMCLQPYADICLPFLSHAFLNHAFLDPVRVILSSPALMPTTWHAHAM
jgi:hypothetical protein